MFRRPYIKRPKLLHRKTKCISNRCVVHKWNLAFWKRLHVSPWELNSRTDESANGRNCHQLCFDSFFLVLTFLFETKYMSMHCIQQYNEQGRFFFKYYLDVFRYLTGNAFYCKYNTIGGKCIRPKINSTANAFYGVCRRGVTF